jgi:hypothetical protein
MATRTNPLVSAAVLASAAAIAVATPAIMPSVQVPSPHALQAAQVQLATFADLLSITALDYDTILFNGYGEAISPNQDTNFDPLAPYVGPFTGCDFNCTVPGVSGVLYVVLDALFNGNDTGYAPVLEDPSKPYNEQTNPYVGGYPTWSVGPVNYLFEGGWGSGLQALVTQPFVDPTNSLYNPTVAGLIAQAFQGVGPNLTNLYVTALQTISVLALQLPGVGQYAYGGIQAYLGYPGYPQGLSGILKYVTEVIAGGGVNPIPTPVFEGAAASVATLAAAPAAAASVEAPKVAAPAESAPATGLAKVNPAAAGDVKVSAPADTKVESAPAVSEVKVSVPDVSESKVSAPAAVDTPSVSAPEDKPVVAPSVPEVTPSAPAVGTTPVKDLGKEIAKAEAAVAAVSEPKADVSDSKSGGSDAKVSTPEATSSIADATPAGPEVKADASDAKAGGSDAASTKDAGDGAE